MAMAAATKRHSQRSRSFPDMSASLLELHVPELRAEAEDRTSVLSPSFPVYDGNAPVANDVQTVDKTVDICTGAEGVGRSNQVQFAEADRNSNSKHEEGEVLEEAHQC